MIYVKRTTIFALLGSLALGLGISCEQAPKVLPTKELAPDEKVFLDSSDKTEILSAFSSITQGKKRVNRPVRAIKGVRWSDVPNAVAAACGENGVEMAVVETWIYVQDDQAQIECWQSASQLFPSSNGFANIRFGLGRLGHKSRFLRRH